MRTFTRRRTHEVTPATIHELRPHAAEAAARLAAMGIVADQGAGGVVIDLERARRRSRRRPAVLWHPEQPPEGNAA